MEKVQYINSDFLAPKDAWDALSLPEKAAMMNIAVKNGIYNLSAIRQKYNEFAEGGDTDWGYNSWKQQINKHLGLNIDEDNTYDYEGYFNKYPQEAWAMLKGSPDAHFTDEFKTIYHPTFSQKSLNNDGSIYSGIVHPKYNPQGLIGGIWSPDYKTFTMSSDGYKSPISMDERKWYLENAEDNGVILRESDGTLPIYDDILWGGVLPNVTVYGKKHSIGGPLVEAAMNEYKHGGGIHIKPSHRGRLTELKKRTGKTEAELYNDGNPAHKRMVVFARNSRKWKHGEGGPLINLFYPEGTITYGQPYYDYDSNGKLILDENGKPTINYNATASEVVVFPSREPIGLDRLARGINVNSNLTVSNAAKEAGEAAVRKKNRRAAEAVEKFNNQNETHSIFPVKEVSGETVYEGVAQPKVIGLPGADPVGEFFVAGEFLGPLFRGADMLAKWGNKYMPSYIKPQYGNTYNTRTVARSSNSNVSDLSFNKENILLPTQKENIIFKYANSQENPVDLVYKRMSNPVYAAMIRKNSDPNNSSQEGAIFFEGIDPYDWDSQQVARAATRRWWEENEEDLDEAIYRIRRVNSGMSGIASEMPFANPPSPFIYMPDKNTFFNLPMFTDNALKIKDKETLYNIIKAHELAHNVSTPNTPSPLFEKLKGNKYWGYLNNREVAARGTQIKNYFNKGEITEDELKYAAKHYSEDTGIDNNMSQLFGYIEEEAKNDPEIWKKVAEWISNVSPIGLLTLTSTNNDKK